MYKDLVALVHDGHLMGGSLFSLFVNFLLRRRINPLLDCSIIGEEILIDGIDRRCCPTGSLASNTGLPFLLGLGPFPIQTGLGDLCRKPESGFEELSRKAT